MATRIKFHLSIFLFLVINYTNAQSTVKEKERVKEIKKWYAEVQSIGLKNCEIKKMMKYEGLSAESDQLSFEQKVSTCRLNDYYQVIKGEFQGYEWLYDIMFYRKNGKAFFVFIKGASEGYMYERRYYFDEAENLIQELEKESEDGGNLSGPNKEVRKNLKKNIRELFAEDLREINKIKKTGV